MMPTTMATTMATEMRNLGVADFRLALPGIQASFRRLADDSNLVLGDGGTTVVSLTDTIAQADKTIQNAPYTLFAESATQRPALAANLGILWDGAALDLMKNDIALGTNIAGQPVPGLTVYAVGELTTAKQTPMMMPEGAQYGDSFGITGSTTVGNFKWSVQQQVANGGDGNVQSPNIPCNHVFCGTYAMDGSSQKAYADGTLADTRPSPQSVMDRNYFRLYWGDYGANPNYDGIMYELLFCYQEHDATQVASTTAALKAWYGL